MAEWKKELGRASGVQFEYPRGSGEALLTKEALVLCRGRILASASAQLKASSTFNSIEKFTSQKCLVIELRELQQVHAGAGCGEPLKVRASVVNTKCGIQLMISIISLARSWQKSLRLPVFWWEQVLQTSFYEIRWDA